MATGRLRFVAPERLAGVAHVMVDGAARPGTAYTLSHWPRTPTPVALRGDLSAEIVQEARRHPEALPEAVAVASTDHYDVDGVVALGLLLCDGLAARHGPLLVEAARVGDFDVVRDARAARLAFALNALDGPGPAVGDRVEHALGLVEDLADDVEGHEALWGAEWAAYDASVRAMSEGRVVVEERPDLDLAVVRIGPDHDRAGAGWGGAALHRAAVHSATTCLRVAVLDPGAACFYYRYESWVRLTGPGGHRRPRPRVDLTRLAERLSAVDAGDGAWHFEGAGALTASLSWRGSQASTVAPADFLERLAETLADLDHGPPAWDPYQSVPGPPGAETRRRWRRRSGHR